MLQATMPAAAVRPDVVDALRTAAIAMGCAEPVVEMAMVAPPSVEVMVRCRREGPPPEAPHGDLGP